MPATLRALSRPTRSSAYAALVLALLLGLGGLLPGDNAWAAPQSAMDSARGDSARGDSARAGSGQDAAHGTSKHSKKARIRARKARWAMIRRVNHARGIAMAQRGDSYGYGAAGPNSFDCSGLVYFSYRRAGFAGMPRTSSAQAGHTRRIPRTAMRPGDLMFFTGGGGVYHVGIFIGRGRGGVPLMVHSSRPGTPVQVAAPWTTGWFAGTMRRA